MSPAATIRLVENTGWPKAIVDRLKASSDSTGKEPSVGLMIQNLTPQLLAVFRLHGFGYGLAQVLAEKLSGELGSRVQELLWCPDVETPAEVVRITIGSLRLDLERRLFWRNDEPIHLSPKEFDLLALMMKRPDVPFTHVKLLRSVWGVEYAGEREYLRTYVCSLRKKIERNPASPEYLVSERWIGYRFRDPNGPVPPSSSVSRSRSLRRYAHGE